MDEFGLALRRAAITHVGITRAERICTIYSLEIGACLVNGNPDAIAVY